MFAHKEGSIVEGIKSKIIEFDEKRNLECNGDYIVAGFITVWKFRDEPNKFIIKVKNEGEIYKKEITVKKIEADYIDEGILAKVVQIYDEKGDVYSFSKRESKREKMKRIFTKLIENSEAVYFKIMVKGSLKIEGTYFYPQIAQEEDKYIITSAEDDGLIALDENSIENIKCLTGEELHNYTGTKDFDYHFEAQQNGINYMLWGVLIDD